MDRLTKRNQDGTVTYNHGKTNAELVSSYSILEKLARYEELEADGRLIELPCGIGDEVYSVISYQGDYERAKDKPYCHKVVFIGINGEKDFFHTINEKTKRMFCFNYQDIGKTVFLTPEEAEQALKEVQP